jgi:hypothetical protein
METQEAPPLVDALFSAFQDQAKAWSGDGDYPEALVSAAWELIEDYERRLQAGAIKSPETFIERPPAIFYALFERIQKRVGKRLDWECQAAEEAEREAWSGPYPPAHETPSNDRPF